VSGARSSQRSKPALALAFIALLLSLAGTTYAGVQIGRGSVGTFQLRNGAVTAAKLRNGAVTAAKLQGCPANTVAIGPGCVEADPRAPAGYSQAVATCASIGGRLPFISELTALAALGRPLGNPELVADIDVSGTRLRQTVFYSDPSVAIAETIDTPRRYRCVTAPL
jgi:hypothetical protein